jgi:hypothetical protein
VRSTDSRYDMFDPISWALGFGATQAAHKLLDAADRKSKAGSMSENPPLGFFAFDGTGFRDIDGIAVEVAVAPRRHADPVAGFRILDGLGDGPTGGGLASARRVVDTVHRNAQRGRRRRTAGRKGQQAQAKNPPRSPYTDLPMPEYTRVGAPSPSAVRPIPSGCGSRPRPGYASRGLGRASGAGPGASSVDRGFL